MNEKYEKILHHKAFKSKKHRPMPILERAFQFAPFAALVGYEDKIKESSNYLEERKLLSSEQIEELDQKIKDIITLNIKECVFTYYQNVRYDKGNYLTKKVKILKVDTRQKMFVLRDEKIRFKDIIDIEIETSLLNSRSE